MQINRTKAETPKLESLAGQVSALQGPCVGCPDCVGLCEALIETLILPDVILSKKRETS